METAVQTTLTPLAVGRLFGVKGVTVIAWLKAGWIRGTNVAPPGSTRERWRFSLADVEAFKATRASQPPAPAPARRQKTRSAVREYV